MGVRAGRNVNTSTPPPALVTQMTLLGFFSHRPTFCFKKIGCPIASRSLATETVSPCPRYTLPIGHLLQHVCSPRRDKAWHRNHITRQQRHLLTPPIISNVIPSHARESCRSQFGFPLMSWSRRKHHQIPAGRGDLSAPSCIVFFFLNYNFGSQPM